MHSYFSNDVGSKGNSGQWTELSFVAPLLYTWIQAYLFLQDFSFSSFFSFFLKSTIDQSDNIISTIVGHTELQSSIPLQVSGKLTSGTLSFGPVFLPCVSSSGLNLLLSLKKTAPDCCVANLCKWGFLLSLKLLFYLYLKFEVLLLYSETPQIECFPAGEIKFHLGFLPPSGILPCLFFHSLWFLCLSS